MENLKKIKRSLLYFFSQNEWNYADTIVDISIKRYNSIIIEIEITTIRPGLLIGSKGSFLKRVEEFLATELETEKVEIFIKEHNIWNNIYN